MLVPHVGFVGLAPLPGEARQPPEGRPDPLVQGIVRRVLHGENPFGHRRRQVRQGLPD
jgi:hypothetical protein